MKTKTPRAARKVRRIVGRHVVTFASDTFLEMAAEIIDPVEWVALQMTKLPVKPGMTRGEAMDLVKAVVREGFEMLKRQEAQNKEVSIER
jgi:hypothetical protein